MRRQNHLFQASIIALCLATAGTVFASGEPVVTQPALKAAAGVKHSRGKPTSGVIVEPSVPETIALGQTVTVRLEVSGITAHDGATVEVRDPSRRETLAAVWLMQGERRVIDLPYTGRIDGMQFVDIATTQDGGTSVVSVPLRVGSGELRLETVGKKVTTPTGEKIILMLLE